MKVLNKTQILLLFFLGAKETFGYGVPPEGEHSIGIDAVGLESACESHSHIALTSFYSQA